MYIPCDFNRVHFVIFICNFVVLCVRALFFITAWLLSSEPRHGPTKRCHFCHQISYNRRMANETEKENAHNKQNNLSMLSPPKKWSDKNKAMPKWHEPKNKKIIFLFGWLFFQITHQVSPRFAYIPFRFACVLYCHLNKMRHLIRIDFIWPSRVRVRLAARAWIACLVALTDPNKWGA